MLYIVERAAPGEDYPGTFSGVIVLPAAEAPPSATGQVLVALQFRKGRSDAVEPFYWKGVRDADLRRILCAQFGRRGWYFATSRLRAGLPPRGGRDREATDHTWYRPTAPVQLKQEA